MAMIPLVATAVLVVAVASATASEVAPIAKDGPVLTAANNAPSAGNDPSLMAAARAAFADDGGASDKLGGAVAISGDTAVVGASGHDVEGEDAGAAYVFTRIGARWVQQAKLVASDPGAGASFGAAVGISEDTVVVGATGDDHAGRFSGSAYVFTRTDGTWTQQAKLTASDAEQYDNFGLSVSVSGDSIAVGVPGDQMTTGSVYIFTRSGSAWTQQTRLVADSSDRALWFGNAVSLDGDTIAIGHPRTAELYGAESGAVYVFTRTAGVWTKQARLIADDYANWMQFGYSVALSGDSVLVGAPARRPGSAYVFTRSGTAWSQQAKLTASDTTVDDSFASAVALSGDTAIIGSPSDNGKGVKSGAVRVFVRTASGWTQAEKFVPSDASTNDQFGYSVALSGESVAAGAPGQDSLSPDCGAMYATGPSFLARADGQLRIPPGVVLGNDSDVDGDELTAELFTAPAHGSVVFSADGAFVYTPAPGWSGEDSFTYRAFDGLDYSSPATVKVASEVMDPRPVTRAFGADRYSTAASLAVKGWDPSRSRTWPGVKHIVIANGETGREPDPLAAAGLAGAYDCPVLLTGSASLPYTTKVVIADIARSHPGVQIHIVGGTSVVPDARWSDIKRIPGVGQTEDRIAGRDRYETSVLMAKRIVSVKGAGAVNGVILIAGDNPAAYFDALAASPIAYAQTMPMLSVKKGSIPTSVATLLKSADLKDKPRYVASSATFVGSTPAKGAIRMAKTSSNRYTAAAEIATFASIDRSWTSPAHTAITCMLPDALAGGAFLGRAGGVLLFTDSTSAIQPTSEAFITGNKDSIENGWIIGGISVVRPAQETSFRNLLN